MCPDVDIQELEEQAWPDSDADDKQTLEEYTFADGTTVEFLIQDPDTDTLLDYIAFDPTGEADRDEDSYDLVDECVIAPEVTLDRWRDLRTVDKIGLTDMVTEAIGLDELMDFTDVLPEAEQDEQSSA